MGIYGLGGIIVPFVGIKLIDCIVAPLLRCSACKEAIFMKSFLNYIKGALALTVVMLAVCGFAYPAALTGLGQVIFPHQANGSLLTAEGRKDDKTGRGGGICAGGAGFLHG